MPYKTTFMKTVKKLVKYALLLLIIVVLGGYLYLRFGFPSVRPAENIKIEANEAMIEHGRYLAENVMLCTDCHSVRDWSMYAAPFEESKKGAGGEEFNQDMGFPGKFYSKNITPFKLKDWTDGEIFRAMVCGVNKDGEALFPMMPYQNYAQLDREDLYAVIAYIRTLESVENENKMSEPDFPMNLIMRTIPQDAEVKGKRPGKEDRTAYGKYLLTAASCMDCHSQRDHGEIIEGLELAGGMEFKFPDGNIVRSANITPHKETGIGNWTEEGFILRFRAFSDSVFTPAKLQEGQINTVMPWMRYSGMTDEDLGAIYTYLMSIKGIKNEVKKYSPKK